MLRKVTGSARVADRPLATGRGWGLSDRPQWSRRLLAILGGASLAVVLGLWAGNHGLTDLASPGSAATSLGRVTGLVAADLLLIQVILMARVPLIELSWGRDQLTRWHRLVGLTSFNLMLAHILLITVGYASAAEAGLISEAWDLVVNYPGMLLATAATVALIGVVVTSFRAIRPKFRYESWHLLHLYAYLGVGLAIPHELWTGTDFVSSPAATAYWWSVYALAAGCIVVFRLGLPVYRSTRHRLRVRAVVREAPGVYSVHLSGRRLDRLPVRSGQFCHWRFLSGPGWSRAHPYSLSAAPHPDRLRITVKALGDDSALVRRLRPGTRVLFEGPYGTLTGAQRQRTRVTMIASGIGITPLRALLESLPYPPGAATLVYRARADADFAFRAELDALAAQRGIRLHYLAGRRAGPLRWAPHGHGSDVALLRRLVPDLARHDVYVCGPDTWMDAVLDTARRLGVPEAQLHSERFAW
jgi:predicted ferric reductase